MLTVGKFLLGLGLLTMLVGGMALGSVYVIYQGVGRAMATLIDESPGVLARAIAPGSLLQDNRVKWKDKESSNRSAKGNRLNARYEYFGRSLSYDLSRII